MSGKGPLNAAISKHLSTHFTSESTVSLLESYVLGRDSNIRAEGCLGCGKVDSWGGNNNLFAMFENKMKPNEKQLIIFLFGIVESSANFN